MKLRNLFSLSVAFAVGLSLSCEKHDSFKADPNAAAAKLARLKKIVRLEFPAESTLEEYEYETGLDDALHAKVKMPQSKLEEFLRDSGFYGGTVTRKGNKGKPHQLLYSPNWWGQQVEVVTEWEASEIGLPNGQWLFVLIDTVVQEDGYSVYLYWFET